MALAFDTEKKIYLELNLARSEKFPGRFTPEEIENIKKEINDLEKLLSLKEKGVISEEEFLLKKKQILGL